MNFAKTGTLYSAWRMFRELQQVRHISKILRSVSPSIPTRQNAPAGRCVNLRQQGIRRRLVLFGAKGGWEETGLWSAFGRAHFFDYGAAFGQTKGSHSSRRAKVGQLFRDGISTALAQEEVSDVFFYASGAFIDPLLLRDLRAQGIRTVVLGLDDKQQLRGRPVGDLQDWQLEVAREATLYWTTWRTGADWLRQEGVNAWYSPPAASAAIFRPEQNIERDIDVLWLGRCYGPRVALIEYLRSVGVNVHTRGPGWPGGAVSVEEMVRLFARARIVLGMGGVGQTDSFKHLKARDFEVPMSGALYLTSFNPELTDCYQIGQEILCYSSPVECADIIKWLLPRPKLVEQIRSGARRRALADHTWQRRLDQMWAKLDGDETCHQ